MLCFLSYMQIQPLKWSHHFSLGAHWITAALLERNCLQNSEKNIHSSAVRRQRKSTTADGDSGRLWLSRISATSLKMVMMSVCMIWLWICDPVLISGHKRDNSALSVWLWEEFRRVLWVYQLKKSTYHTEVKSRAMMYLGQKSFSESVKQPEQHWLSESWNVDCFILPFVNPSTF